MHPSAAFSISLFSTCFLLSYFSVLFNSHSHIWYFFSNWSSTSSSPARLFVPRCTAVFVCPLCPYLPVLQPQSYVLHTHGVVLFLFSIFTFLQHVFHSLSLYTQSQSHTHNTHTYTLTPTQPDSWTHSHTCTLIYSYAYIHSYTLTKSHIYTHSYWHWHRYTLTHIHAHTHTNSLIYTHTYRHKHPHTHTYKIIHTLIHTFKTAQSLVSLVFFLCACLFF